MSNLKVPCGSIAGVKQNIFGYTGGLIVELENVDDYAVLDQIDQDKIEAHLAGLYQATHDDEAAMVVEQLQKARESESCPVDELPMAG